METIIKTYLFTFLLTIGLFIIITCSLANQEVAYAREYHNDMLNEIECSGLSPSVINSCIDNTIANTKYNLTVNEITNADAEIVAVEVILNYKYSIPLLGISEGKQLRGFAR